VSDLHPFLAVRDVEAAVRFYAAAFGAAEEGERLRAPNGLQVAVLTIAGRTLGVSSEQPDNLTLSPETAGGTTVRLSLEVDDPEDTFQRAVAEGATVMFAISDQPYGMRQGRVVDPFGHHWLIGTPL
jgi:PhnB protein